MRINFPAKIKTGKCEKKGLPDLSSFHLPPALWHPLLLLLLLHVGLPLRFSALGGETALPSLLLTRLESMERGLHFMNVCTRRKAVCKKAPSMDQVV